MGNATSLILTCCIVHSNVHGNRDQVGVMGNTTSLILTNYIVHSSVHGKREYVGMVRCNGKWNIIDTYKLHCS